MFVRVIRIFHEYENRFYLRVRFIKTVCLVLDRRRNSDKKKREKRIVFSTDGKPIFPRKEIRFQSLAA